MKSGRRMALIFCLITAVVVGLFLAADGEAAQHQGAAAPAAAALDTLRDVADETRSAIADPIGDAQRSMAMAVVPALVAAQGDLALALPAPPANPDPVLVSPAAVDMIVAFEVVSPAYYVKRLQRPVWPGGASGVTWGIGYDGGHQTRPRIAQDWVAHPAVAVLAGTSGVIGTKARTLARELRGVVTPLPLATDVFAHATLPAYESLARRTFHNGWDCLAPDPRGSLTATVMNRGASMRGESRREMRQLRDDCVPRCDTGCMATAYRSMKRVWRGTDLEAGLGRRYEATARLAEGSGA